jgi:hypothetical protein
MFDVNFIDAQHQVDLRRLISRWPGIRIDAALDLCDPLLMLENQHRYGDCSTNEDRHNRHQQSTKTYDRIEQPHSRLRKPTTVGPRPTTNDGFSGGADRDRTGGLLVANQALSQLSYSPLPQGSGVRG